MKKIISITVLFLALSTMASGQAKRFQDMIGRWEFVGEQNAGASLEILDSSTMVLNYMGETRKIMNIKLDFSKSPLWFDFAAQDTASIIQVKSLLEVGDNVMKWQLFVNEDRSPHFTSKKGEILYLKRAKSNVITASN